MGFEWGERKRERNLLIHRVDFIDVLSIFGRATLEIVDGRFDYGETRIRCLGEVEGRVYAVVYTWRGVNRRIISARKANAREKKHITRVSVEASRKLKGKTDFARLDALGDEDIAQAVAIDPDAAPLDVDWTSARLVLPPGKELVTLRLDRDVLDWFRKAGKGYQTRINAVLRAYKDAHSRAG
jgi:uncharacterized protein (DUF4415 family)